MHGMDLNREPRTVHATTGYLEVETKVEQEDRYESHYRQEAAMGGGHYDRGHHHNDGGYHHNEGSSSDYHYDGATGADHHDDHYGYHDDDYHDDDYYDDDYYSDYDD